MTPPKNNPNRDEKPERDEEEETPQENDSQEDENQPQDGSTSEEDDDSTSETEDLKKAAVVLGHVAAAVQSFFAVLIATLANPLFWLALVLGVLAIGVYSTSQVVGKNENANGCAGIGGDEALLPTGGNPDSKVDIKKQRDKVGSWLMSTKFKFLGDKPMTKEQAAAFTGNWQQESGLNPAIGQAGFLNKGASNADIKAVQGGGKAVGFVQWDGARRTQLAEFADSKGKLWSDLGLQLEFIKFELDGAEGAGVAAAGFGDTSKSLEELTEIVNCKYERSGDCAATSGGARPEHRQNRVTFAKQFMQTFKGGGGDIVSTGGSCLMEDGGSFDASGVVKLAVSISYPTTPESRVGPGDEYGVAHAPDAYKAAKAEAVKKGGRDDLANLYASCDRFVATVMKNTIDKDIPWGPTESQYNYLRSSKKWQQFEKKSEAKPGDIFVTKVNGARGHIMIYIGKHKGQDSIAHASYLSRVAGIGSADYLNENLVDTGGRAYYGYHFVGGGGDAAADKAK